MRFLFSQPLFSNVTLSLHPTNIIDNLSYFLYNNLILQFSSNLMIKTIQGDR